MITGQQNQHEGNLNTSSARLLEKDTEMKVVSDERERRGCGE